MWHGGILECANHVQQLVCGSQLGELIGWNVGWWSTFSGRRRRWQVDVGHVGRDFALRLEDLGQLRQPLVGDLDHADVHGHPTKTAGFCLAARQRVENGGLARAGKPDYRDLQFSAARLAATASNSR